MQNYHNFINGKFVPSSSANRIEVTNPSTGQTICTVPDSSQADVDAAIAAAEAAQSGWAKRPAIERAKALRAIAAKIREHVEPLARVITEEQGKVLGLARVEVAFTADYLDYMAEWARRIEGEILESDRPGETIFLFRQPIGVDRRHPPLEFPVLSHRPQGRPRPGHRQHHCDQAQRGNAPQRRQVLRAGGGNRSAAGRHQHRPWTRRLRRQGPGLRRRASA